MTHTGLRVVRGPDWKYGEQDGGCGHVGTVTLPDRLIHCVLPPDSVFVTWDCGVIANYRIGLDGAFDLVVFDNSTKNVQHIFVTCDCCEQHGIIGIRWKCEECDDFDLCSSCYMNDKHELSHRFWRIDTPLSYRILVPSRISSRKIEAKGIFEGAMVIRGSDWQWGDQDGGDGGEGIVTKVTGGDEYCWRNMVDVKWKSENCKRYRLGHEGKIDVQFITEASGGYFYYEHLPNLGQYALSPNGLSVGDKVKVLLDAERLEDLHKDEGLWNPAMIQCIGRVGTVVGLRSDADILVYFSFSKQTYTIKACALDKVPLFKLGDVVEIISDSQKLQQLQEGHGGWVSEMKQALGKQGKVIHIHPTGDIRVIVSGHPWTLNPDCCKLVDNPQVDGDSDGEELSMSPDVIPDLFGTILQSVMERSSQFDRDNIVHQSERGDLEAIQRLIAFQPEQVNVMKSGKRALQAASFKGHLDAVNLLLEAGADVNLADGNGDTALHVSALGLQQLDDIKSSVAEHEQDPVSVFWYRPTASQKPQLSDEATCLEVLLGHPSLLDRHKSLIINRVDVLERLVSAGANVDLVNSKRHSSLQIAANLGHLRCVEILLQNDCDVNLMDEDGDTALHDAIYKGRDDVFDLLLSCPKVDLSRRNRKTFTVLHHAVFKGNLYATRKLVDTARHLVNDLTVEGHSALHIASVNGYRDIAQVLIDQGKCDLDVLNNRHHTPLMLAVSEGRSSLIELLVSKGAKVGIPETQGCTCLHLALGDHEVYDFTSFPVINKTQPRDLVDAPSIAKICMELPVSMENRAWVGIACFLVQHGADINVGDAKGKTPLSIAKRNPLVAEVLERYARQFSVTLLSECMMCSECPAVIVFQPCGHKIVCTECSIRMKKCFLCHVAISEKISEALVTTTTGDPRPGRIDSDDQSDLKKSISSNTSRGGGGQGHGDSVRGEGQGHGDSVRGEGQGHGDSVSCEQPPAGQLSYSLSQVASGQQQQQQTVPSTSCLPCGNKSSANSSSASVKLNNDEEQFPQSQAPPRNQLPVTSSAQLQPTSVRHSSRKTSSQTKALPNETCIMS